MNLYTTETELEVFNSCFTTPHQSWEVNRPLEYVLQLMPKQEQGDFLVESQKKFALTLMGVTHGNELAGLAVVNKILALLESGVIRCSVPLQFILGNPWAALANKRFLERDLNRSFGGVSSLAASRTKEGARAGELQPLLDETHFLLDYHQTTKASARGFFIFPFSRSGYLFARHIEPRITVVTHWGGSFSQDGRCTDEYVNSVGGAGITLELGKAGFDLNQIGLGVTVGMQAINLAEAAYRLPLSQRQSFTTLFPALSQLKKAQATKNPPRRAPVMTWAATAPWPEQGVVELDPHLHNFQHLQAGEIIGRLDKQPLKTSSDGFLLFPKFLTESEQQKLTTRPAELYRLAKEINESELPG